MAPTMGALVMTYRPRNPVGWLLVGQGLVGAFVSWAYDYALYPTSGVGPIADALPAQHSVAQFALGAQGFSWTFVPFIFLLFPDGRLPSRRWRPVAGLTLVTFLFLNVVVATTTQGPSFGATQPVELSVAEYYGSTVLGALTRYAYWAAVVLLSSPRSRWWCACAGPGGTSACSSRGRAWARSSSRSTWSWSSPSPTTSWPANPSPSRW